MRRIVAAALLAIVVAADVAAAGPPTDPDPWSERRVLNVAHAGGDLEAPHSTLFAMKTAVEAGTDVLEMDVRLSADGVLMVHHDSTVDRTTEASGPMRDRTAAELQALDNAHWFVPNCWSCRDRPADEYELRGIRTGDRPAPRGFSPSDFTIPTLADLVDAFPDRILDVEIKDGPDGMAAAEALAVFIAEHGPADRYIVASFDEAILAHFKSLAPAVATSPSLAETVRWFLTGSSLEAHRVVQVPPTYQGIDVVTQAFVDAAHSDGIAVWVWFNGNDDDTEAEWQRLIDLGVDGLLTGKPVAAQAVIDANDASFAVGPRLGASGSLSTRHATIDIECPAAHVDECSSVVVLLARDRRDRLMLLGLVSADVARATTANHRVTLVPGASWRLPRGPVTAYALMFPADDDTAPAILATELSRG